MFSPRELGWRCRRCAYQLHTITEAQDGSVACPECGLVQIPNAKPRWKDVARVPVGVAVVLNLCAAAAVAVSSTTYARVWSALIGLSASFLLTVLIASTLATLELRKRRFGGRALVSRVLWIGVASALSGLLAGVCGGLTAIWVVKV